MQCMMLLPFPKLKGEETLAALNNFIRKIGTRNKKLSKKQIKTLNNLAKRNNHFHKRSRTELEGCNFVEGD